MGMLFVVALCAVTAPLSPDSALANSTDSVAPESAAHRDGARSITYIEDFESFALGAIDGQGGWTANNTNAQIINSGLTGFGSRTFHIVPSGGSYAVNQVSALDDHGLIAFDFTGTAMSTSDLTNSYAVDIYGDGGLLNARLFWFDDGSIQVLQAPGGVGTFVDTGDTWTPNVVERFGIEIVAASNTVNFYRNGTLFYSGHDMAVENGEIDNGFSKVRPVNFNFTGGGEMSVDNFGPLLPAAPEDLDGNGSVGGEDLAILLAAWGGAGPADLDGNGSVGGEDLAILLAAWSS